MRYMKPTVLGSVRLGAKTEGMWYRPYVEINGNIDYDIYKKYSYNGHKWFVTLRVAI